MVTVLNIVIQFFFFFFWGGGGEGGGEGGRMRSQISDHMDSSPPNKMKNPKKRIVCYSNAGCRCRPTELILELYNTTISTALS